MSRLKETGASILLALTLASCAAPSVSAAEMDPQMPPVTPSTPDIAEVSESVEIIETQIPASPLFPALIEETPMPQPETEAMPSELKEYYDTRFGQIYTSHPAGHHLQFVILDLKSNIEFRGGEESEVPAASIIKLPIALYAIFKYPQYLNDSYLPATPEEAERIADFRHHLRQMIVNSSNVSTSILLDMVADDKNQPIDEFNNFAHQVLKFPINEGMSNWDGLPASTLSIDTPFYNPITLESFVPILEMMESNDDMNQAISASYQIYGNSSPDYSSQVQNSLSIFKNNILSLPSDTSEEAHYSTGLEDAMSRAQARYPDVSFAIYGKDGSLPSHMWSGNYRFVDEVALIVASRNGQESRLVVTYAAGTYELDDLLDAVLELSVDLIEK